MENPMTAFVNEDATMLCAVSNTVSIDDSNIDVAGTDIERMQSTDGRMIRGNVSNM